jgi:hypothetical protein
VSKVGPQDGAVGNCCGLLGVGPIEQSLGQRGHAPERDGGTLACPISLLSVS